MSRRIAGTTGASATGAGAPRVRASSPRARASSPRVLPASFYRRDPRAVAPDLLNKLLAGPDGRSGRMASLIWIDP